MKKTINLKQSDTEYKLTYDDNISYESIMKAMNLIMAGKNAEAGDSLLISQIDVTNSDAEVMSNNFARATAALHMLSLIQAFDIEEKKN